MSDSRSTSTRVSTRTLWYIVGVLTLTNVAAFVDRQVMSLVVVPLQHDLGLSDTQISLLMGAGFVILAAGLSIPLGRYADTRSRRGILTLGLTIWSAMTAMTGLVRSYSWMLFARAGVGGGEATLQPAALSLIADAAPRDRLGSAMSVYTLGTFLGSGVAYVLGAWGVAALGRHAPLRFPFVGALHPWQAAFVLLGVASALLIPIVALLPEPRRAAKHGVPLRETIAFFRTHANVLAPLSLGFAFSAAVNYGIAAWLATFFVRTHGWSVERAGTLQGLLTMTVGVIGTLTGGWISDALVKRGHDDAPFIVGIVAALGMIVFAGIYPLVSSATLAAVLLIPVNFFAALPWGPATAAAAAVVPAEMRAEGGSLNLFIVNVVSGLIGPTAVALVTDRVFGTPGALRYSLAIVTVAGMLIAITLFAIARKPYARLVARTL